jgi:site-specific DNA-methyltransferase (adenine-specific)
MKDIPDGSVDMVLTDPPYGTTACKWDSIIPLEPMWEHLKRVIKPNGAIVMTASQPFTTTLIASNLKMYKQILVFEKTRPSNVMNAKKMFMKWHEDVVIFYNKLPTYNPQKTKAERVVKVQRLQDRSKGHMGKTGEVDGYVHDNGGESYPKTVLRFKENRGLHPTQKPVALMEYLIKTYTNEGETVLDFTMGSGTTGVAAKNLNRNFIGIELDEGYFEIAKKRIDESTAKDSE